MYFWCPRYHYFFLPQILSAPLWIVKAGKRHGEKCPLASNMGTLWVITNLKRLQKRALSNIPWYNNHFPWKICVIKTTNLKNTYAFWHPNIPLFCKTSLTFRIPVEVDLRGIMTDSFIFVRSSASTQGNSYIHNKVNLAVIVFAFNWDKHLSSIVSFYLRTRKRNGLGSTEEGNQTEGLEPITVSITESPNADSF